MRELIFYLVLVLAVFSSGCESVKKRLLGPTEEVAQRSYPILVYEYDVTIDLKATPKEFIDYLVKDVSWMEMMAGKSNVTQLEVVKIEPDLDMTRPGEYFDLNLKAFGINFPCRVTSFSYKPAREIWFMALSRGSAWVLFKYMVTPIETGSRLHLVGIGRAPKYLSYFMDPIKVTKVAAKQQDILLAFMQARFDPDLDVDKTIQGETRGHVAEAFLQGYESSIWVEARPKEVISAIFQDPDSLNKLIPLLGLEGECQNNPSMLLSDPKGFTCCESWYGQANEKAPATILSRANRENRPVRKSYTHNIWSIVDVMAGMELEVKRRGPGSLVTVVYSAEIPGQASPAAIEKMMSITQMPGKAEAVLTGLKSLPERTAASLK